LETGKQKECGGGLERVKGVSRSEEKKERKEKRKVGEQKAGDDSRG
jgi:hypothetical protein